MTFGGGGGTGAATLAHQHTAAAGDGGILARAVTRVDADTLATWLSANQNLVRLASTELAVAGDVLEVTGLTTYDNYIVDVIIIASGLCALTLRFNNDGGAGAYDSAATEDGTRTIYSATELVARANNFTTAARMICFIRNRPATQRKGCYGFVDINGASESFFHGNWTNVVDLINRIACFNTGAGDYGIGSRIAVFGYNDP